MSARLRNLNPYELHKYLVNVYCLNTKGSTALLTRDKSKDKTDLDVIRENHKFLWEDNDEADTWEKQLAKKYYDKLFKEYCICDLSRYKENKVALRWRVEKEVVMGKGQFVCGNKQCCSGEELRSWEVNFAYREEGEARNALVKIRLCPECSDKLNYRSKKREIKRLKKQKKRKAKSKDSETVEGHQEVGDGDKVGDDDNDDDDGQALASTSEPMDEEAGGSGSLWKKGVQEVEEKSREEEFADYLEDLLL